MDKKDEELLSELMGIIMTGGIRRAPNVVDQPEVQLSQWSVRHFDRDGSIGDHLCGYLMNEGCGRTSTAVQEFDPATRRLRTRSGRIYELVGPPGSSGDAEFVWNVWSGNAPFIDRTAAYWAKIQAHKSGRSS